MVADSWSFDLVMIEKFLGLSGIFRSDKIHLFQRANSAHSDVFKIANWGGNDIEHREILSEILDFRNGEGYFWYSIRFIVACQLDISASEVCKDPAKGAGYFVNVWAPHAGSEGAPESISGQTIRIQISRDLHSRISKLMAWVVERVDESDSAEKF